MSYARLQLTSFSQFDQMAKKLIDEEDDDESVASADPNAATESDDMSVDDETEVKVNGVGHAG